jgi:hypothetical protein
MNRAKAAARQAGNRAVRSPAFAAGVAAERDGTRMFQSKQMAEATASFYEAAGHFRSAELGASAPDTQIAPPATQSRAEPQATPQSATPAPPPSGSAAPAPIVPAPPTTSAPPPEPAPAAPPPSIPPAVRTPSSSTVPVDNAKALDEGVRELIRRYEQALEARSIDALKRLWPSLQGAQEQAIREEFMHARRIDVEISNIDIGGSGNTATASFLRRYQLSTVDNQRLLTNSRTTLNARRNGGDWVIERVQFEAIK